MSALNARSPSDKELIESPPILIVVSVGKIQASANIVTINPESTIKLVFLKSMFTKITFYFFREV
jgi:hypothetical protein